MGRMFNEEISFYLFTISLKRRLKSITIQQKLTSTEETAISSYEMK